MNFTVSLLFYSSKPYLDVLLIKEGNKLETTVYRKPNLNDNIIPKSSGTLLQYKLSTLGLYTNRAIRICSTEDLFEKKLCKIKEIDHKAGYSGREVSDYMKEKNG